MLGTRTLPNISLEVSHVSSPLHSLSRLPPTCSQPNASQPDVSQQTCREASSEQFGCTRMRAASGEVRVEEPGAGLGRGGCPREGSLLRPHLGRASRALPPRRHCPPCRCRRGSRLVGFAPGRPTWRCTRHSMPHYAAHIWASAVSAAECVSGGGPLHSHLTIVGQGYALHIGHSLKLRILRIAHGVWRKPGDAQLPWHCCLLQCSSATAPGTLRVNEAASNHAGVAPGPRVLVPGAGLGRLCLDIASAVRPPPPPPPPAGTCMSSIYRRLGPIGPFWRFCNLPTLRPLTCRLLEPC